MTWSVPRLWEGETVVVLASGASMNEQVAEQVRGHPCIVVNRTVEFAPWADMLYAADSKWWRNHPPAMQFAGIKVSCEPSKDFAYGDPPPKSVHTLRVTGESGFDPDPSCIRTGQNSGYQALHVAVHTGASRILLCGFNMQGQHWHGRHPTPLNNPTESAFVDWTRMFERLAPLIAPMTRVINCTPNSALRCFEWMPLPQALAI